MPFVDSNNRFNRQLTQELLVFTVGYLIRAKYDIDRSESIKHRADVFYNGQKEKFSNVFKLLGDPESTLSKALKLLVHESIFLLPETPHKEAVKSYLALKQGQYSDCMAGQEVLKVLQEPLATPEEKQKALQSLTLFVEKIPFNYINYPIKKAQAVQKQTGSSAGTGSLEPDIFGEGSRARTAEKALEAIEQYLLEKKELPQQAFKTLSKLFYLLDKRPNKDKVTENMTTLLDQSGLSPKAAKATQASLTRLVTGKADDNDYKRLDTLLYITQQAQRYPELHRAQYREKTCDCIESANKTFSRYRQSPSPENLEAAKEAFFGKVVSVINVAEGRGQGSKASLRPEASQDGCSKLARTAHSLLSLAQEVFAHIRPRHPGAAVPEQGARDHSIADTRPQSVEPTAKQAVDGLLQDEHKTLMTSSKPDEGLDEVSEPVMENTHLADLSEQFSSQRKARTSGSALEAASEGDKGSVGVKIEALANQLTSLARNMKGIFDDKEIAFYSVIANSLRGQESLPKTDWAEKLSTAMDRLIERLSHKEESIPGMFDNNFKEAFYDALAVKELLKAI